MANVSRQTRQTLGEIQDQLRDPENATNVRLAVRALREVIDAVIKPGKGSLTRDEVATRFGVSSDTVDRWVKKGAIRAFVKGRVVRFREADVEAFESGQMTGSGHGIERRGAAAR